MIKNEYKQHVIDVITKVLKAIHNKDYNDISNIVDQSEITDMESLFHCVQKSLEMNGFDCIDEYGIPCNFHPKYEYSQIRFYEFDNHSGFDVEYDLTSSSELVDMCLQMKFLYTKSGLKSIFESISPQ